MECERKYEPETASRTLLHNVPPCAKKVANAVVLPPAVCIACEPPTAVAAILWDGECIRQRISGTAKNIGCDGRISIARRGDRAEAAAWRTAPRPNLLTLRRRRNDNDITTTLTTIIECDVSLAVYRRTFFNVVTLMSRMRRLANGDSRIYIISYCSPPSPRFSFALIYFFKIFKQKNVGTYTLLWPYYQTLQGLFFVKTRDRREYYTRFFFFIKRAPVFSLYIHIYIGTYVLKQMGFFSNLKWNKFNNHHC